MVFHAPVTVFPFAGVRRGKAEVFKGFELLYRDYKLTGFDTLFTIADDDRAASLTECSTSTVS